MSSAKGITLDESLIDLVRVNPLLFEKSKRIKPYESTKERFELWKSIATSLGMEPNDCIARWKYLRDRFRRETMAKKHIKDKQSNKQANLINDEWPLMEKMRFLDRSINQHNQHHSHKLPEGTQSSISVMTATISTTPSNAVIAEQIIAGVNYEEPLQEAMDEQPLLQGDTVRRNIALATSTTTSMSTQNESIPTASSTVLVRIEALLGGLDQANRCYAEKRILSYLCKCQLNALEGESIENVQL